MGNNMQKSQVMLIGIGDGGIDTLNHFINNGLEGVKCVAINTHKDQFANSMAKTNLMIGENVTKGLGAGGVMENGAAAAESSYDDIKAVVTGADRVFLIASLGGGTGTGSAPVVARIAHEAGADVTAIVSTPFEFEGNQRAELAKRGLKALEDSRAKVIISDNNNLTPFAPDFAIIENALKMAAKVLAAKVLAELV